MQAETREEKNSYHLIRAQILLLVISRANKASESARVMSSPLTEALYGLLNARYFIKNVFYVLYLYFLCLY